MIERDAELWSRFLGIAKQAVCAYVEGMISPEVLVERMMDEWEVVRVEGEELTQDVLKRIARRVCSQELYTAWQSSNPVLRERAFENLNRYLGSLLRNLHALPEYQDAPSEILQQTLLELCLLLCRDSFTGPRHPAAFLGWVKGILIHQASAFRRQYYRSEVCDSLDVHVVEVEEQHVDSRQPDPLDVVIKVELQQAVKSAILLVRRQDYQQVLMKSFLEGIKDDELAGQLGVSRDTIHQWRFRALKALRRKPEIMEILLPWLDSRPVKRKKGGP